MTITTQLVTLAASAVQFPAAPSNGKCCRVYVEPLRTNLHASFVGTSAVTNNGSGTGVIKEMAQPGAATVIMDFFSQEDQESANTIDPTQFWGHGTAAEILKVTYFQR